MFDKGGKEKNEKTKKDRTKLGDVISCRAVANRCLWWEKWIPIRFGLFLCFCIRFIFVGKVLVDTHFRAHLPFHLYTLYRSKKKRQNKTKQICFFFSTSFFFFLVLSTLPRTQDVCLFFFIIFQSPLEKRAPGVAWEMDSPTSKDETHAKWAVMDARRPMTVYFTFFYGYLFQIGPRTFFFWMGSFFLFTFFGRWFLFDIII